MRDSLELFEKTLKDYSSCKDIRNHLIALVESLYKDLENERNTTAKLQQQIITLTREDSFGITSKFAALKGEYIALKDKLTNLKNENEDLNIQIIAKNQEAQQLVVKKEEEMKSYYLNQLKQKDEKIAQQAEKINNLEENIIQKEVEFFSKMHGSELSSVMELDKMESEHKNQLAELHNRLKDSNETSNVLRVELMNVKDQFIEYKRSTSEKIGELQKRLRESHPIEQTLCQRQENMWDNVSNNKEDKMDNSSIKYQPLNITSKNLFSFEDKPINLKKTPQNQTSGRNLGGSSKTNNLVPPLIALKETKSTTKESNKVSMGKKRKLYNPDDLTYLGPSDNLKSSKNIK